MKVMLICMDAANIIKVGEIMLTFTCIRHVSSADNRPTSAPWEQFGCQHVPRPTQQLYEVSGHSEYFVQFQRRALIFIPGQNSLLNTQV